MPFYDLPEEELVSYKSDRAEPEDFQEFWKSTLAEAQMLRKDTVFEIVDYGLRVIETFNVTFSGYGGQPIKAWLNLPRDLVRLFG